MIDARIQYFLTVSRKYIRGFGVYTCAIWFTLFTWLCVSCYIYFIVWFKQFLFKSGISFLFSCQIYFQLFHFLKITKKINVRFFFSFFRNIILNFNFENRLLRLLVEVKYFMETSTSLIQYVFNIMYINKRTQ